MHHHLYKSILLAFFVILLQGALFAQPIDWYTYSHTVPKDYFSTGVPKTDAGFTLYLSAKNHNGAKVRGLILVGNVACGGQFSRDSSIRAAAEQESLAIIFISAGLSGIFDTTRGDDMVLYEALGKLAIKAGRPEIEFAPWLSFGHSTSGRFSYEIAWWKPERTFGVITFKSGQIHEPAWARPGSSIQNVPLVALSGQMEEVGPGPSGILRPYETRQTQWWSIRDTMMKRRPTGHLMFQLAEPGAGHGSCNGWKNFPILAMFIKKAAQWKIPVTNNNSYGLVTLKTIKEEDGWLADTIINHLIEKPNVPDGTVLPHQYYLKDKSKAYWLFDREMAQAWLNYHHTPQFPYYVVTSLAPNLGGKQLSVYPNPASGVLYVELPASVAEPLTITVSDYAGRSLLTQTCSGPKAEVNIQGLAPGSYLLEIKDGSDTRWGRFVKQ